ncbi:MAG: AAA family ATPase [Promethearchaeota archaeon]|jgi:ATP-dependent DNA helicase PIF1
MKLNKKQTQAYTVIENGENLLLTGPGGTGKTTILSKFVKQVKKINKSKKIIVTSTTGTSALQINGVTLHSYTSIGLGNQSVETLVLKISKNKWALKKWKDIDILIIDEISMLSPELFDVLDKLAKILRKSDKPFGGIQLILSGDFLQLPVVRNEKFCFEAEQWGSCIKNVIVLEEIVRQSDTSFIKCLNKIRVGDISDDVKDMLMSRMNADLTNAHGIEPTRLFSTNFSVDEINEKSLDELATDDRMFNEYEMHIVVQSSHVKQQNPIIKKYKKHCMAVEILQLCVDAQVMLLTNIDFDKGLVNGSRGVVVRFEDELPVIKFLNGEILKIERHTWDIEEEGVNVMSVTQIPLKVAYAISIHKSQGSTLDYVEMDLTNIFEYGQGYVALSRVTSLQGLSITGIDFDKIRANPIAIDFYERHK